MISSAEKVDKWSGYERILVPISGEETDREVIRLACELSKFAKKAKCKILILYVIQVRRSLPLDAAIEPEVQKAEQSLSEAENVASACECECDVETDVLQAREVGVAIVDEAIEHQADIILLGAGYKKRLGVATISPTALAVLRDAPCRVVLIRPPLSGVEVK
ncbi:MAG: universal stress protein [Chloroflexi bacterium]|nr:universal stress protein [Chloroflexota bacterium]